MDENHPSLPTPDARLTPPPSVVAGLPAADVVALLGQWGVFDAETVVRTADPAVLDAALREISARFAEIKNPGAYLRRLLAGAGAAPQRSRPVAVPHLTRSHRTPTRPTAQERSAATEPGARPGAA